MFTIKTALESQKTGEKTRLDIINECYRRIHELNPILNAFITVGQFDTNGDGRTVSEKCLFGGIPVAVKDLFETAGIRTTAGSMFFTNNIPENDALVIRKLKEAGAHIIGKTNTHEIALGVTGINPHFGTVKNPYNLDCISGGSSSGSAVAVAAGMCLAALGTDTGGSTRIPASLCGIVGFKPSYGRIGLQGVIPLSNNLDHVGILAHTVWDVALLLQLLAGHDSTTSLSFSMNIPVDDFCTCLDQGIKGWRVAKATGLYVDESNIEVMTSFNGAVDIFGSLGATIIDVDCSWMKEAAQNNVRMTQADAAVFHKDRLFAHPERFGEDVRHRLEMGSHCALADYAKTKHKQTEFCLKMKSLFKDYDILLTPTTPICAPKIDGIDAIATASLLTKFTAPFNLTGLPALSIPCGYSTDGLPIGLQIISRRWAEQKVLIAGQAFEKTGVLDAHRQSFCDKERK